MHIKFLFPFCLFLLVFLSCEDKYTDPLSSEYLFINNHTDTTIYVDYGHQYDSTIYYLSSNIDSIRSNAYTINVLPKSPARLWMDLSKFEQFVSKFKIYQLKDKDTIFIKSNFYSSKSQWNSEFIRERGGSLFSRSSSTFKITINYVLTVEPKMFDK
jgi:hypothetical protein